MNSNTDTAGNEPFSAMLETYYLFFIYLIPFFSPCGWNN